jgi:hypothetical protein
MLEPNLGPQILNFAPESTHNRDSDARLTPFAPRGLQGPCQLTRRANGSPEPFRPTLGLRDRVWIGAVAVAWVAVVGLGIWVAL